MRFSPSHEALYGLFLPRFSRYRFLRAAFPFSSCSVLVNSVEFLLDIYFKTFDVLADFTREFDCHIYMFAGVTGSVDNGLCGFQDSVKSRELFLIEGTFHVVYSCAISGLRHRTIVQ
jgi:hypothetical protein